MRHLIWVCTVSLCPIYRMRGVNGLKYAPMAVGKLGGTLIDGPAEFFTGIIPKNSKCM